MIYTFSDIYKNFDYEKNEKKPWEEIEITKYKGIQCGQANGFHHLLNIFFLKQSFKNVIELGTQKGGTSLFLKDLTNLHGGNNFITFDKNKCNLDVNQVLGYILKDQEIINLIKTNIQKEGKTLLFCDGGDKKCEFNTFSPFLKNGDFIIIHDYAHDEKFFNEEINGKIWFWHEAKFADIKESVEKYNLISYNTAQMSAFVYGCFYKETISQLGADDWVLSNYEKGYFVDAGCCDGEQISNTYKLEKLGWSGICIDVFPKNFDRRPNSKVVEAALHGTKDLELDFTISKSPEISGITDYLGKKGTASYTGWEPYVEKIIKVKTQLLHEILDANNAPEFIEYLSIDIEGAELEVLKTFPFDKYKFGCISLEHNYDEKKRNLIKELLAKNNYKFFKQEKADDWFYYDKDKNPTIVEDKKSTVIEDKKPTIIEDKKPANDARELTFEFVKSKKIGLCMIVKNESKIIERCLNSVKPLIDYVCIVDTGSTDDTVDVINNWMKSNDIDGQVVFEPWKDFAYNRSFAMKKIREKKYIDYALMIDADEILMYEEGINFLKIKESLTCDLHYITCKLGSLEYLRTSITKNDMPYFYKGVVHEYLECEEHIKTRETIKGIYNIPFQDSARNQNIEKYQHDANVLQDTLKIETDPFLISRYTFYLAQSYRDSLEKEKAIYWYNKRSKLGFWDQEIYISLYKVAKLKEELEYPEDDIIQSYMRAYEISPERIEAIHGAVSFCRRHGRNNQAYTLAKHAISMPVNKTGLFLENWIWDYGIYDEFTISCYWSGHYKEGLEVSEKLIDKIPEEQKERILKNIGYLKEKLNSK